MAYPSDPVKIETAVPRNTWEPKTLPLADVGDIPTSEFAWLIERGQPEGQTPTVWVMGFDDSGWARWTENANEAVRYASKDAAEVLIKQHLMNLNAPGASARAVEHGWMP